MKNRKYVNICKKTDYSIFLWCKHCSRWLFLSYLIFS